MVQAHSQVTVTGPTRPVNGHGNRILWGCRRRRQQHARRRAARMPESPHVVMVICQAWFPGLMTDVDTSHLLVATGIGCYIHIWPLLWLNIPLSCLRSERSMTDWSNESDQHRQKDMYKQ